MYTQSFMYKAIDVLSGIVNALQRQSQHVVAVIKQQQ